jgi:hypothetical protein
MIQPDRPRITILLMRFACWITKSTDAHSEYVTLIAFPVQQWLQERASMLCYTYIGCHVKRVSMTSCRENALPLQLWGAEESLLLTTSESSLTSPQVTYLHCCLQPLGWLWWWRCTSAAPLHSAPSCCPSSIGADAARTPLYMGSGYLPRDLFCFSTSTALSVWTQCGHCQLEMVLKLDQALNSLRRSRTVLLRLITVIGVNSLSSTCRNWLTRTLERSFFLGKFLNRVRDSCTSNLCSADVSAALTSSVWRLRT